MKLSIIHEGENMKKLLLISFLVIAAYFAGCKEDTTVNPPYSNTPIIASTNNAFTFTLAANSYSANVEYELSFTTDSLAYSIIVSGFSSGSGSLTMMDSNSSNIYVETLRGNKVVAFTQTNHGIPKKVKLVFNGFSGTFNFALSRSNTNK